MVLNADSSNPGVDGQKIAFTSLAGLRPNVFGQQVYAANPCLLTTDNCGPVVVLASADASGKPIGGDFAAMEVSGAFVAFATTGSSSSPGTLEIFLTAPFF